MRTSGDQFGEEQGANKLCTDYAGEIAKCRKVVSLLVSAKKKWKEEECEQLARGASLRKLLLRGASLFQDLLEGERQKRVAAATVELALELHPESENLYV